MELEIEFDIKGGSFGFERTEEGVVDDVGGCAYFRVFRVLTFRFSLFDIGFFLGTIIHIC